MCVASVLFARGFGDANAGVLLLVFAAYDYQKVYDNMLKPAFIFDGRVILDHAKLSAIGFTVHATGKRLE